MTVLDATRRTDDTTRWAAACAGVSIVLQQVGAWDTLPGSQWATAALNLGLALLVVGEIATSIFRSPRSMFQSASRITSLLLALTSILLTVITIFGPETHGIAAGAPQLLLVIRALVISTPPMTRAQRLTGIVAGIVNHPARTVTGSFLLAILGGAFVLMLPFTSAVGIGLPMVDALFTATSAICVTGLIVVDTATAYTVWGQIVIVLLIQIGGLGIMVFALFAFAVRRQSVSVESKLLLSYMLSESRMSELSGALRRIVVITGTVELVGAGALFALIGPQAGGIGSRAFIAVFHSVSAFCNAGFALFTTSLEQFHDRIGVNLVIAALIIGGGISFGVLTDLFRHVRVRVRRLSGVRTRVPPLTVNTRTVLVGTVVLLTLGMLMFYALEHGRSMAGYPTGVQYLAAFFQSTTLRTAGFNTIPMDDLATATYLMMMFFMFVGGASGSIAGGIKINNAAVIAAYLRSRRRRLGQTLLFGHAVNERQVATAFTVLLVGILSVLGATFVLAITESASLVAIAFEAVSAFGTVGLSTGITPNLTWMGRLVITVLMFTGRVGALTLLAASTGAAPSARIAYPSADVSTG